MCVCVCVCRAGEGLNKEALALDMQDHAFDDVDVGIVRAAIGVAETGSVLLTEREMPAEALGFLAQHLVVLLDPAAIVATPVSTAPVSRPPGPITLVCELSLDCPMGKHCKIPPGSDLGTCVR